MSSEPSPCHPDACPAAVERGSVRRPTPPCSASCSSPTAARSPAASAPWPARWASRTVAVYSDADEKLPFVQARPTRRCASARAPAKDSYLNIHGRSSTRRRRPAPQAVHPGYGFVSENAEFAARLHRRGHRLRRPAAGGDGADEGQEPGARRSSQAAGVPVVPGTRRRGAPTSRRRAREAERIGYPVLSRRRAAAAASAWRWRRTRPSWRRSSGQCTDRAKAAFGREGVYLERYFPAPRHIEVQILGDSHGNLHPRASSASARIQRRHQKVVEEAGSAAVRSTARTRRCAQQHVRRRR